MNEETEQSPEGIQKKDSPVQDAAEEEEDNEESLDSPEKKIETKEKAEDFKEKSDEDIDTSKPKENEIQEDYPNMPKKEIPFYEKKLGSEEAKKGNYLEAIRHFSKALLAFKYLCEDFVITEKEEMMRFIKEVQLPSLTNSAMCYFKLNEYKMAIKFCDTVFEIEDNNVKALYRRAASYLQLNELDQAEEDIKQLLTLEPEDGGVKQLKSELALKRKEERDNERKVSKKIIEHLNFSGSSKPSEPLATRKNKSLTERVGTMKDKIWDTATGTVSGVARNIKMLFLLPFDLVSSICCRRRLPSQFYKSNGSKAKTS
jgi:tetratricopeptide (TPR) repeat protein